MIRNLFGQLVAPRLPRGVRGVGCDYCPLNNQKDLTKVINLESVVGKKGMVWAQSPGELENIRGVELVGKSGEFLWEEAAQYGLRRKDFDIQNVLRCRPKLDSENEEHEPTKDELRCCSVYNTQALDRNQMKAQVHLILGEVAGRILLKDEYKKSIPVFWKEGWNAYIVLAPHPSYVLRCGGRGAGWIYLDFKDRLKAVAAILRNPGRWGYVKAQNYGSVQTGSESEAVEADIRREAALGNRISVDIEDAKVAGKHRTLLIGFGSGSYTDKSYQWDSWKGNARSFVLWPETKHTPRIRAAASRLITDPSIKKILQHGSYDVPQLQRLENIKLRGYDYDSQYAAYLRNSNRRSYSLESLVRFWFQEFADYKSMVSPYRNFADVPLETLVQYNCADCDVTKRVEQRTMKHVNHALLMVYIHVAFVLDKMEAHYGPVLDRDAHQRLSYEVPRMLEPLDQQLRIASGRPDFNAGSPDQVAWLLYDHLGLPRPIDKEGNESDATGEEELILLSQQTKSKIPLLIVQNRTLRTIRGTFLGGYENSAKRNNGELRTVWWLCLAEGELVQTDRGYIPVQEVTTKDKVLTHRGRLRSVSHVHENGEHPVVRVTLANGMTLRTTGNHPYRVGDKWIEARNLKVKDLVTVYGSQEKWKTILEYPSYRVSTWGRIINSLTGKAVKFQRKDKWGHLSCHLNEHTLSVSRIVAKTFLPFDSERPVVRHLNGYAWDNNLENLKWGTELENHRDSQHHGSHGKNPAVTEEVVAWIRSSVYFYGFDSQLAKELGISRETIRDIRKFRYRSVAESGKSINFTDSEVVEIEIQPSVSTYGLTVEEDCSHVTQGIVTHNTGAATGRLRSGKGESAELEGIVNFQNLHGNPLLLGVLATDKNWRKALTEEWKD